MILAGFKCEGRRRYSAGLRAGQRCSLRGERLAAPAGTRAASVPRGKTSQTSPEPRWSGRGVVPGGTVPVPIAAPTRVERVPVPAAGQEPAPLAGDRGRKSTLGHLFTGGGPCFAGRSLQPSLLSLYKERFLFRHIFSEPRGNPGGYYQPTNLTAGRGIPALPCERSCPAVSPPSRAAHAQVLPRRPPPSASATATSAAALFRQAEPTQPCLSRRSRLR